MWTASLSDFLIPLAVLSLGLGVMCGASLIVAVIANRASRQMLGEARLAMTRAALAESALADIRHRRSVAVSKGNRTRAEVQAERRRVVTAELRRTVEIARTEPQGALPLESMLDQVNDLQAGA